MNLVVKTQNDNSFVLKALTFCFMLQESAMKILTRAALYFALEILSTCPK